MKIAVENGVKTWKYVETILRDWADKGYQTVEQVHAAQKAFKEQQAKKRNGAGTNGKKPFERKLFQTGLTPIIRNMNKKPRRIKKRSNANGVS